MKAGVGTSIPHSLTLPNGLWYIVDVV
jgi:hypothetical protein